MNIYLVVAFIAIVFLFHRCGGGIETECIRPHRGEIRESFMEPAKTRLANTYPITMPIHGRIGRIELEPGDEVKAGQELVVFDRLPFEQEWEEAKAAVAELEAQIDVQDYNQLEETVRVETEALVDSTSETVKASKAQAEAEQVRSDHAAKEFKRIQALAMDKSVSLSQLDKAQMEAETALIELRKQEFSYASMNAILTAIKLGPRFVEEYLNRKQLQRHVLVHQLVQAKARLVKAEHDLNLASIRSPIDGVVLERRLQGDSLVNAGEQLLLLGNRNELEAIADVLTQDAMRLTPGSEVAMEPAVGFKPLAGKVKRIEPAGFTKLSSLGVEQQRVNVIVELTERPDNLGVGYQLQARFLTGAKNDALIVPRSCVMQSLDQSYYVWKVNDGSLQRQTVTIGLRSDLELEIANGLAEEDAVVLHPDVKMQAGMKIRR
jgi:HlyD family secretion protein